MGKRGTVHFISAFHKYEKVVYISCNLVTQERNLRFLNQNSYKVEEIQTVDLSLQMVHVETVILIISVYS